MRREKARALGAGILALAVCVVIAFVVVVDLILGARDIAQAFL